MDAAHGNIPFHTKERPIIACSVSSIPHVLTQGSHPYFFALESTVIGFQHTAPAEPFIWQKRPVLPSTTEKCSGPAEYLWSCAGPSR